MKSIYFGDHSWVELEERIKDNPLVIVPVGMFEEHGRHCPVSLDSELIWEFCVLAAKRLEKEIPILLLPPVWCGYHGFSMAKWPGSIRLEQETLFRVVYDICASLIRQGITRIVIANGHGQNPAILELVTRKLIDDFGIMPVSCMPIYMLGKKGKEIRQDSPQGAMGGHADELETSLMLDYKEHLVDMSRAVDDTPQYYSKFVSRDLFPDYEVIKGSYWSTWEVQNSQGGAQGNPLYATKEKGEKFRELIVDNFVELLREYYSLQESRN